MFAITDVQAHCDIPCKIYDPATAQIAVLSVIRLLDLIHELGDTVTSAADSAQLVRLTEQKETHAAAVKHDVATIWGDYFKAPQIEAYPEVHELVHTIMQQASKCKQGIERENGENLLASVNRFAEIFWATKGVETTSVIAPYPPAMAVIQPVLASA
ncbi:superoxide dismutase, Ni [Porticoccaceae bacterium]|jgi:nickel superoxide dismutase|nr:superoxide dismutase, Ni [Porticoccaceae bacterium]MDA8681411.1 superoxide dismutase, Ni [Porticoccaceae bacterium]MDB2344341.1 superoxide dismutase, Ni [Porticoccaceae bacterium]MDB2664232.1 superoxide dismutase, Ni [Porticoccaceae bacterium]MDC0494501.1 superoxide dismutase, Ni [bacterium]